jgi:hypothetical protein
MADRSYKIMFGMAVFLIFLVLGAAVWGGVEAANSRDDVSEIRQVLNTQESDAALDDCRARIASEFGHIVQQRDSIGWSAIPQLIGIHAGTPAELLETAARLEAANAAVLALPSLEDAVNNGYEINGVAHPPCPKR